MLRVSKLTDYATLVMTCLAGAHDEVLSAQLLAERARLEVPTVSKVLKQLAAAGLVDSWRGANWQKVSDVIRDALESVSLADMLAPAPKRSSIPLRVAVR